MAVDTRWIAHLQATTLGDTLDVLGRRIDLPSSRKDPRRPDREWQRRVSDDLIPDSPHADSPEKTPFEIVSKLSEPVHTARRLQDAIDADEVMRPLAPLFVFQTRGQARIPVAFHVVAIKAADSVRTRSFSDRTFLLLLRDADGRVDVELARRFVETFRRPYDELDLAQQTFLKALDRDWTPAGQFAFLCEPDRAIRPFVPEAGERFRADLRTLLDAELPPADVFRYVNQLLALHFGLYQPRLAAHLNPAMELLLRAAEDPHAVDAEAVARIERGEDPVHRFAGAYAVRAPSGGAAADRDMPAARSFAAIEAALAELHFSLLVFNRVRSLTRSWLSDMDAAYVEEQVRYPSSIIRRMQDYPDFHEFLCRAAEALCVRFGLDQLADSAAPEVVKRALDAGPTGLHALRALYVRYNLESASRANQTRAYKQGGQVTRSLLTSGEMGLVQARRGWSFFEIGAGLLPLLLLTIVGTRREKVPVDELWLGLERYGLTLPEEERERLLRRLKAMGLYERFSDAGEASYVRGLVTGTRGHGR